jgi:hypothetical protein
MDDAENRRFHDDETCGRAAMGHGKRPSHEGRSKGVTVDRISSMRIIFIQAWHLISALAIDENSCDFLLQ